MHQVHMNSILSIKMKLNLKLGNAKFTNFKSRQDGEQVVTVVDVLMVNRLILIMLWV